MKHLCLVSDQPMANFLPVLDDNLQPTEVTLVVSAQMQAKANFLREQIRQLGIGITEDLVVSDPSNISRLQDEFMEWVDKNNHDDYVLNATGGTKPMAIAAQEVCRAYQIPIFYLDIMANKVTWMKTDVSIEWCNNFDNYSLQQTPTLNQFFKIHGVNINKKKGIQISERWRYVFDEFVMNQLRNQDDIGKLNYYASVLDDENHNGLRYSGQVQFNNQDFHDALYAHDIIKYTDANKFEFRNDDAKDFCNGGWLEEYVYQEIFELLNRDIRRVMKNLEITSRDRNNQEVKNELDVVAMHGNTCYVFECKTKSMKTDDVVNDAIYKLAAITSRRMGLKTRSFLISYRTINPDKKRRAKEFGIDVIDNLSILNNKLREIFPRTE